MKIGVTGASGFIGKRIIEMGLDKGYQMVAFVRSPTKLGDLAKKIQVFTGDIANKEDIKAFVDFCDVIIHTAAVVSDWAPKAEYQSTSIDGTRFLLDHFIGTSKKLVHASSVAVYTSHIGAGLCTEDLEFTRPFGNYSWSKQEQEKLILKYGKTHNIQYSIIRPGNIFGPFGPSWVKEYIEAMKQGPILIGNGDQKSLTFVDNVCEMFLLAAVKPEANGQIFNGTDDQEITFKEYAFELAKTLNWSEPKSLPKGLAIILGKIVPIVFKIIGSKKRPPLTTEAVNFVAYTYNIPYTKASNLLGYKPVVNKKDALRKTMAYVKDHVLEFNG